MNKELNNINFTMTSIQLNKDTREVTISSPHSKIIRCLINATEEEINNILDIYRNIENEYRDKQYVKKENRYDQYKRK